MEYRILESNRLYRRIENRNVFKTFSRSYKKRSFSRNQDRSKLQSQGDETISSLNFPPPVQTLSTFCLNKPHKNTPNSQRNQLPAPNLINIHQKYSTKIISSPHQTQAFTTPLDQSAQHPIQQQKMSKGQSQPIIGQQNQTSETMMAKWNLRKKCNQEFRLKSYLERDRINYEFQHDQSDFSTLQLRKRSEILQRVDQNLLKKRKIQQIGLKNNTEPEGDTKKSNKTDFLFTKHSRFTQVALRNTLQLLCTAKK